MESALEKGKVWAVETLRTKAAWKNVPMLYLGSDYWWVGEGKTTLRFADKYGLPTIAFTVKELETVTKDSRIERLLNDRITAVIIKSLSDTPDKSRPIQ